jgi:uncharacterized membrane protein YkoI
LNALILAGGLTAFALVLVLALAGRVAGQLAEPAAAPTAAAVRPTQAPTPGPDPAVQALLDEREAAYRLVVQQANERLVEANRRLSQVQARPPALAAAQARPAYIGPDVAAEIARLVAPGSALGGSPELVNFQGTAAYEVTLSAGKVYVDARTGQVLHNGVTAQVAQGGDGSEGGNGGSSARGGDEHEGEDDSGEDDEHEDREDDEHDDEDHAGDGREGGERDG